jgi:beta-glucosidase
LEVIMSAGPGFSRRFLLSCAVVVGLGLTVGMGAAYDAHRGTATMRGGGCQAHSRRLVDSLLARMTWAEKLGQLNLVPVEANRVTLAQEDSVRQGLIGGFLNLTGADATEAIQRMAVSGSRLGIPLLLGLDVIHGYRTIFPMPLAEASTWDPGLVERSARAAAQEAAAAGVNWTFAPMVDIARDPRWGRIAEGSGEDPYLGSVLAAARVRGFQGPDLRSPDAVLATAKHFAAYGAAEGGRDYNTADVSERTLRETYLPPFRAAVRAGVGSIMSAFNEIAGVPSSANRWLLTDVLRREWGFRGFVVSDWGAIDELRAHGVAAAPAEAARLAMAAGVDMDMSAGVYVRELPGLLARHEIAPAVVDEAVRRVLRAKVALGLFDDPYRGVSPERERARILTPASRALARRDADEAIVLLKNDRDLLPLAATVRTIAVIGPLAADSADALGSWHAVGRAGDVVTPLAGIQERVSPATQVIYARGCAIADSDTTGIAEAVAAARRAEVAVLMLGEAEEMSGEAASRAFLDLPGVQQRLLEAVQATGTPVVLVLMTGRPLALPWAAAHVRAMVEAWFVGVETGHALADLLFGDVAPSGKLPVSVPRTVGQVPIYYDHKNTGRPASDEHYTSKYLDVETEPLFPFGFGLSYTTFRYGAVRLSADSIAPGDSLSVSAVVSNTGERAGEEVVQLYVRDEVASVTRPVRALAGFRRVSLQPGETRTVRFTIGPEQLGFYDAAMQWVVEPGRFTVSVGGSSTQGVEASFDVRPRAPR